MILLPKVAKRSLWGMAPPAALSFPRTSRHGGVDGLKLISLHKTTLPQLREGQVKEPIRIRSYRLRKNSMITCGALISLLTLPNTLGHRWKPAFINI